MKMDENQLFKALAMHAAVTSPMDGDAPEDARCYEAIFRAWALAEDYLPFAGPKRLVMNPFGSAIYVLVAIFVLAAALIGYGTYSDVPLAILIGAALGLGVVGFVLYVISKTRF